MSEEVKADEADASALSPASSESGESSAVYETAVGEASAGKKKKKKKKKKDDNKSGLGTSRGIETMFRTSYRTNMDLSALADAKANIMISINGIIISIILASISPKIDTNPWLLIPTAVLLLTCLGSMALAVLAARPRVSSQVLNLEDVRNNNKNLLFFGNFVSLPEEDFVIGMKELLQNTDSLYVNMIRDIYGLGTVLKKKFSLLRRSYNVFMFGLIIGVLLFIGVYAWVVFSQSGLSGAVPP
ncbi:MAG: Pycsar system effector family protein [Bacteroidota bacterium]